MKPSSPSTDLVLLIATAGPIRVDSELIDQACKIFRTRLGVDAMLTPALEENLQLIPSLACDHQRVVILPCGFESIPLDQIRSAWWFGQLPNSSTIFLAEPWTPKEVGQWIGNRARSNAEHAKKADWILPAQDPASNAPWCERQIETLALVAFWSNRICPCTTVCAVASEHPESETLTSLSSTHIEDEELATWIIQRYLRCVRSRPIPWNDQSDAHWPALSRLHQELQLHLPSEYAQRLDEVSPRSMGSAKISPDESGRVPWDTIWTSFCDLAMAGGPPHRGKLLEPVSPEEIQKSPNEYASVVAEIRRGIELASGLTTCDSPYSGWVCVQCDSDQMAAWLMRAILVENISVRRESDKLYLPAGPNYRIDKEIKNVITSVAKTNHYWQAHLRSRQPPKPL